MKRLILVIFIFFFIATGMSERAYADSVDLLYSNYSIQQKVAEGYNMTVYNPPDAIGPIFYSSDFTSTTNLSNDTGLPLSASITATPGWGIASSNASSSISPFSVYNHAHATGWGYSWSTSETNGNTFVRVDGNVVITGASASWGFIPTGNSLEVDLTFLQDVLWVGSSPYKGYRGESQLSVTLEDTTDSTTLISLYIDSAVYPYTAYYSNNYTFAVNPNHIYELDCVANGFVNDGNYSNQEFTASVIAPEPTTILLLGLGLVGLAGVRRKFKQ